MHFCARQPWVTIASRSAAPPARTADGAIAIAFAREGADLLTAYLEGEDDDAAKTAKLVRQADRRVVTVPGDLREEAVCQYVVDRAIAEYGRIDILVNNAAY